MSANDEPIALSTRLALAAALSAAGAYLHGLMGAILAERHVEHIASWAGGVSSWLGFGAFSLGLFAGLMRSAESELMKAQLYADNMDRWERSKQAQLTDGTSNRTEPGLAAVPCNDTGTQLEAP